MLVVGLALVASAAGGVYWFLRERQAAADALVAAAPQRAVAIRDGRVLVTVPVAVEPESWRDRLLRKKFSLDRLN